VTGSAGRGWKSTGWYVEPRNSRDVMSILGAIGVYSSGQSFAWRGMSSSDYAVTSSLSRSLGVRAEEADVREAELALLREARSWGLGVGEAAYVDDLQLLSDLQHYGISTRLVDFTSNPMTALWFACQEPTQPPGARPRSVAKSGVLLALNITKFRHFNTVARGNPTWAAVEDPSGYQLETALSEVEPFVVRAVNPNPRLRAQEGLFVGGVTPKSGLLRYLSQFQSFTISGRPGDHVHLQRRLAEDRPRGKPADIPFVAVIIRSDLKAKLLRYLEATYNRTARVLFPDYTGFLDYGQSPRVRPVAK
jgi:hypothetical protein